jgi:hypothetical protein
MEPSVIYHGQRVPCEEYVRAYEAADWDTVLRYVAREENPSQAAAALYEICKERIRRTPPEQPVVELPKAIAEALHGLQRDPEEIEYGGAIDFELLRGRPVVERIIAYVGGYIHVPGHVLDKLQAIDPDYEVGFHTHPNQFRAYPSLMDIRFFVNSHQQAEIIVATGDMLILTKGPRTPKRLSTDIDPMVAMAHGGKYKPERLPELCQALKRQYDIDCDVVGFGARAKVPLRKGGVR